MVPTTANQHQLEEELRGRKDILSVAQVVVSSLELDEVLANILGSAMAVMERPAGSIARYDRPSNKLELHAHQGLSSRIVSRNRWTVKEDGLTATILAQGELFVVEDTSQTDFFNNPLAVEERIHSLIAAERLRERIEAEPPRHLDDYVQSGITVSSGVAAHPRDEQTFNDQFKTVDDLLYVAKRQGKNKVNYLPD